MTRLRESIEPAESYRNLLAQATQDASYEPTGAQTVLRCDRQAETWHRGQTRGDGSPYIVHPRRVALLSLAYRPAGPVETVLISLLHDVVEDCGVTAAELARDYGGQVARSVVLLSAPATVGESSTARSQRKQEKWQRVSAEGGITLLVHLVDVLDNLISCRFVDDRHQAYRKIPRWLWQAVQFHVPLAERRHPLLADSIAEEVRWQLDRGVRIGSWSDV
ncbi:MULTISPECIES: HD domain-containing protein [Micromonospora]|uniref:HD domain-containing protein n=1 Tax=Micromonospora yangpuensis TaxID=683228 RepID=A0A1C6U0N2_9ACTN|nr:HD domain-containing protein [Micromonospora yangpuensis]GGM11704.1 hypothetical protein GCM10012279_32290 [Micromonospora yangpuensis]SCL47547.1 HD domain-containing protein [Micromonospora yangpuensis]